MFCQELHLLLLVEIPHLLTCDTHTVVQLCYADLTGKCWPTHCGSHCEPSFEEWEFEREKGNADTSIKQDIGALPLYFPCVAGIHVLAFCLFDVIILRGKKPALGLAPFHWDFCTLENSVRWHILYCRCAHFQFHLYLGRFLERELATEV